MAWYLKDLSIYLEKALLKKRLIHIHFSLFHEGLRIHMLMMKNQIPDIKMI